MPLTILLAQAEAFHAQSVTGGTEIDAEHF